MPPQTKLPNKPHHVTLAIETDGLTPWHGDRVICICAKDSCGETFQESTANEHRMIMGFLDWLLCRKPKDYFLLTQNGKLFHVPFLCARLELDSSLSKTERTKFTNRLLSYKHLDLSEMVNRTPGPEGELPNILDSTPGDGSRKYAKRLWNQGKTEKLVTYLMKAVTAVEASFQERGNRD